MIISFHHLDPQPSLSPLILDSSSALVREPSAASANLSELATMDVDLDHIGGLLWDINIDSLLYDKDWYNIISMI